MPDDRIGGVLGQLGALGPGHGQALDGKIAGERSTAAPPASGTTRSRCSTPFCSGPSVVTGSVRTGALRTTGSCPSGSTTI
jgi:hypothetical protein